jgi:DNA polymerase (family 10)
MDKSQVADVLDEIAELLELLGENPFKVRAYRNGARAVRGLDADLARLVSEGGLAGVPGLGETMIERITELLETGGSPFLEGLRRRVPAGLVELLRIPGLGPRRVQEIHDLLGVKTVGELEYACHENRLAGLPGFGARMQQKVLAGIAQAKRHGGRFLLDVAWSEGARLAAALEGSRAVKRLALAGSLRRRCETVGDLDVVVSTAQPAAVMKRFTGLPFVAEVLSSGGTRSSVRLESGLQVDLRAVSDAEFPFTLAYFTGSKEHNVVLRARAQKLGYKLNEYGLFDRRGRGVRCADEATLHRALGLTYIPPELREDRGEIAAAARGSLPALVEERDLRGVLHCHSTWSDGANTIREMARAARQAGFGYLGMSDHSQEARYAHGMTAGEIRRQHAEIDRLQGGLRDLVLLKGIEADILPDGSLDVPDALLDAFDFVIGSVHSRFGMTRTQMTRRIVKAVRNPRLDLLGHPTGRLLLSREPYAMDLEAVLAAAVEAGVAVEINANPHRLDLDWRMLHGFARAGGMVSINPDAHRAEGILDVRYGVGIARKGGLTAAQVLNTRDAAGVREWLSRRRPGRSRTTARTRGRPARARSSRRSR